MEKKYIMAIDQGTTGTRVILFNHKGGVFKSSYIEIKQYFPQPAWVEHDPMEYLSSVRKCVSDILSSPDVDASEIAALGITNQRETTIMWDRETGKPVYNAIVWQCRRSASICDELKAQGLEGLIREKTGLVLDAYFSGSKIKWLIDNISGLKEKIRKGNICMGTVDSWLIWNFSGGKYHVTDYANASRTLLLNIKTLKWDDELLEIFGVDKRILPEVKPNSGIMAVTDKDSFMGMEIPVAGAAGDQQAALFGQGCFRTGMTKNTYGTALAIMMNIGEKPILSNNGLTTDLAWVIDGKPTYSFEGIIFIGGAAIQWLRDGLKIIKDAWECDILSEKVPDTGNVYMVPAFTGLGAPYWDMYARGLLIGITRGTTREHICRATEESIGYQTKDVLNAMLADVPAGMACLRVDGGAAKSEFLMQFQSDILGVSVEKPKNTEMAALGAAYLAGLGIGFWENINELDKYWILDKKYDPLMQEDKRERLYAGWKEAVKRSFNWAK